MARAYFLALYFLFFPILSYGYPEFIGYKYGSCITCHYNPNGNGAINDYGRALWAGEIAGRMFAGKQSPDDLVASSGFLGKKTLPWWLRPGIKSRYMVLQDSINSSKTSSRNILMQADVNVAIHFDQEQKLIFVGSLGYVPVPLRLQLQSNGTHVDQMISREHYLRWQAGETLWLSLGMMDKVYGLRIVDHSAFSRSKTGLAQNDQSHGMVLHYIRDKLEISFNAFIGNLFQDSSLRQKGASVMFEYEVDPDVRWGASILKSTNTYIGNQRIGTHLRWGFNHGSALLFEMGLIQNSPKAQATKTGYYVYSEGIQRFARGYHIFLTGQAYKDEMKSDHTDNLQLGIGLLAFPRNRFEFRFELNNRLQVQNSPAVPLDAWTLLSQIHISL